VTTLPSHAWEDEITRCLKAGNIREAVSSARKLAERQNPDTVAACLVELGITLSQKKLQHEDALSLFETARDIAVGEKTKNYADFNTGVALTIVGNSFGEKGQLEEAKRHLRRAVRLYPAFSLAHHSYGRCLFMLGNKKKAGYHLKKALSLDPKNGNIHASYAILLAGRGKQNQAISHLRQAVKLEPDNSHFHSLLGGELMDRHSLHEAEAEFTKAINLDSNNLLAHYKYGILLGRISRWFEAEAQLGEVFNADSSFFHVKELYSNAILQRHAANPQEPLTEKWRWARKVYFEIERPLDVKEFELIKKHRKEWKIIYDNFSCEMCGRCCRRTIWAGHIETRLAWEDIQRWRREERRDILGYVLAFEGLGGDILDMQNMRFLSKCPFLGREDRKYLCSIHTTKPMVCEVAPFYFHNEKTCENCKHPILKTDVYCRNCGMFLKADPHALLLGCPALRKSLKMSGLYKPFRKASIFGWYPPGRHRNRLEHQ
jgi:Flp pilus assembly protein TadD/Fe-S-cluster containining protein